ncbi:helix-turn-helix domain-containing protein [Streptomyces sp. IMTB 1903]|uniref:helix-turn-helix domain-containing protein n=1 Tax=Streptomyces sp. IMTB 1903 TaxID=1776680 RepID=UPI0018FEC4CF|nr:helix-turn-helix domain-containing protein [Streptomyces sp. IMTB 1903]
MGPRRRLPRPPPRRPGPPAGGEQAPGAAGPHRHVHRPPPLRLRADPAGRRGPAPHLGALPAHAVPAARGGRRGPDQRLEHCRADLADPLQRTLPIRAVAARYGFASAADFARAFRAAYGMPPSEYRRAALDAATAPGDNRTCAVR